MSVDWTDESDAAAALRARGVESDLADADLHKYALAAVQEVASRGYGPGADVAWSVLGTGQRLIPLSPAAASVATIVEGGIALTTGTHYRLRPGGLYLERLQDGYPWYWSGVVTGVSTPEAADERYDRVVVDLVKLALEYSGLDSRRDGDYAEEAKGARGGGQQGYQTERELLISELQTGPGFA